MKDMNNFKRFFGSTIDKILILILYVLFMMFVVYTPFSFPGVLGKFVYMMTVPTSDYYYIDRGEQLRNNESNEIDGVSSYFKYREQQDSGILSSGTWRIDEVFTLSFIFINVLYYLLCEIIFKASLGKRIFRGRIFDEQCDLPRSSIIIARNFKFALLLLLFVGVRYFIGISYLITIIAFFIIFDIPVIYRKQNLLDIMSKMKVKCICEEPKIKEKEVDQTNKSSENLLMEIAPRKESPSEINVTVNNEYIVDSKSDDIYKSKKQGKKNTSKKLIFLNIIFLIISCLSVYTYIDYLYGIRALDIVTAYYKNWEYDEVKTLHNGQFYTENSERIVSIGGTSTYYSKERISTMNGTELGKDSTGANWLKKDLGPIPIGEKISSYEIYGTKSYVNGYNRYNVLDYVDRVPKYRQYQNYWGEIEQEFIGYENVPRYRTETTPIYQDYNYARCFSTFDISGEMSFFTSDNSTYKHILDGLAQNLENNYGITPIIDSIKGYRAIIYDVQDEVPMRRVILCANKRMYMLETKSTHGLKELTESYCSNLNLKAYELEQGWYKYVIIPLIILLVISIIAIIQHWRKVIKHTVKNQYAYKLYKVNAVLLIISFIALCSFISQEYNVYPCVFPGIVSMISISIICNTLVICGLLKKSISNYTIDWAVLPWIKNICYNKLNQEKSRRLYLSFVLYPVLVLIATPFCGYAVIYGTVITAIVILIINFNKWSAWLESGNIQKNGTKDV